MQDRVTRIRLDATTQPDVSARTEGWRAAMSVSADVQFRPDDLAGFAGSLEMFGLGDVMLADIRTTPHDAIRNRSTTTTWAHDHVIFDAFLAGGFDGRISGRPVSISAGDCVMFDLKGSMRIRFKPMRCLALIIPRALFDKEAGGVIAVDGLVFRCGSPEASLLAPMLEHAIEWATRLSEPVAAGLGLGLVNIIASCAVQASPTRRSPGRIAAPTLPRLIRFIERHAAEQDFGPEAVRSHFRLSRTAMYRLFETTDGVGAVIRRCRTDLAVRLLTDGRNPRLSVPDIAKASGFADGRGLRRALLAMHGLSPEQVRHARHIGLQRTQSNSEIAAIFDSL